MICIGNNGNSGSGGVKASSGAGVAAAAAAVKSALFLPARRRFTQDQWKSGRSGVRDSV